MGKKTDAFMLGFLDASNASADLLPKLDVACKKAAKAFGDYQKAEVLYNAKVTAMVKKFGDTQFQAEMARDSNCIMIAKNMELAGAASNLARAEREKIKLELQKVNFKLTAELREFTKYITAKEKSKNPFRGKKSVPAAKKMIKDAGDLVAVNNAILK